MRCSSLGRCLSTQRLSESHRPRRKHALPQGHCWPQRPTPHCCRALRWNIHAGMKRKAQAWHYTVEEGRAWAGSDATVLSYRQAAPRTACLWGSPGRTVAVVSPLHRHVSLSQVQTKVARNPVCMSTPEGNTAEGRRLWRRWIRRRHTCHSPVTWAAGMVSEPSRAPALTTEQKLLTEQAASPRGGGQRCPWGWAGSTRPSDQAST